MREYNVTRILCKVDSLQQQHYNRMLFNFAFWDQHGSQTLKIWILLSLIEVLIDPQSDRSVWIQHPPLITITPSMLQHVTQVISVQA